MEIHMTKLTTAYVLAFAKKDKRFDGVDIYTDNQIGVWLDPKYTWCANDGNRSVNIYNIEGSDPEFRDDLQTFLEDVKYIELSTEPV